MYVRWTLDALFPPVCEGCGTSGVAFCGACRPPPSANVRRDVEGLRLFAAGRYEGALRRAILTYKCGRRDVGDALAQWLADRCDAFPADAVLVPVPTTQARRARRGFDQSVRLARELGERRSRPVLLALQHRGDDAQRGRSRIERLAAHGRFACAAPRLVSGVTIVLVDDVVTTGATLADSARTLRAQGAFVRSAVVLASA